MFTGHDPEHQAYRGRAHLSEMIALLGPPPPGLLARANLKSKFFSESGESRVRSSWRPQSLFCDANTLVPEGEFSAGISIPCARPLDQRETSLQEEGDEENRECFLRFMRKMLQWEPEQRSCARDLAEDEWILKHTTFE